MLQVVDIMKAQS